jgi:hypothetical protein
MGGRAEMAQDSTAIELSSEYSKKRNEPNWHEARESNQSIATA